MRFNGTSSKAENTTAPVVGIAGAARFSIGLWFRAIDYGGSGSGRLFCLPEAGALDSTDRGMTCRTNSSTTSLRYNKYHNPNSGTWDIVTAAPTARWMFAGINMDYSVFTDPQHFLIDQNSFDGGRLSTSTNVSTPSGTASQTPAAGICIGNRSSTGVVDFNGDICHVQIWDGRLLTQAEWNQAAWFPGSVRHRLTSWYPLINDGRDLARGLNLTLTQCTVGPVPPQLGNPYYRSPILNRYGKAAAGGGGGSTFTPRMALMGVGR